MYASHAFARWDRLARDFHSIDPALQRLVPHYDSRLAELRRCILSNLSFIRCVTAHRFAFENDASINYPVLEQRRLQRGGVDEEKMSKVRSTLRQCVRDWSREGEKERAACYSPILRELERLYPDRERRSAVRVLVPGSGLGRLTWEVSQLGFEAQGNEFSYFMLLCSFLLLNESSAAGQWEIFPYAHDSKNVMRAEDPLRRVSIPDVDVAQLGRAAGVGKFSMVAGDFMDVYSEEGRDYREKEKEMKQNAVNAAAVPSQPAAALTSSSGVESDSDSEADTAAAADHSGNSSVPPSLPSSTLTSPLPPSSSSTASQCGAWDVVATCYFIDCSNNILETLRAISYCLRMGGQWLNFGPLLFHYADMEAELSVELSWEEVKAALPAFGLRVLTEKTGRQSGYCVDERSMQRSYFYCVELTAVKVGPDSTRGGGGAEAAGSIPAVLKKKTRRGRGGKKVKAESKDSE